MVSTTSASKKENVPFWLYSLADHAHYCRMVCPKLLYLLSSITILKYWGYCEINRQDLLDPSNYTAAHHLPCGRRDSLLG